MYIVSTHMLSQLYSKKMFFRATLGYVLIYTSVYSTKKSLCMTLSLLFSKQKLLKHIKLYIFGKLVLLPFSLWVSFHVEQWKEFGFVVRWVLGYSSKASAGHVLEVWIYDDRLIRFSSCLIVVRQPHRVLQSSAAFCHI